MNKLASESKSDKPIFKTVAKLAESSMEAEKSLTSPNEIVSALTDQDAVKTALEELSPVLNLAHGMHSRER